MHAMVGLSFAFIAAFNPSRRLSSMADFATSFRRPEELKLRTQIADDLRVVVRRTLMVIMDVLYDRADQTFVRRVSGMFRRKKKVERTE